MTTITKQAKLLKALRTGREMTTAQVAAIGFVNPTSAINNLRTRMKIAIYGNKRIIKGATVTKYRIGTPTAAMIADGYSV